MNEIDHEFDFALTGFDETEIDQLLGNMVKELEEDMQATTPSPKYELVVAFTDEASLDLWHDKFLALNLNVKKKVSGIL